MTEKLQALVESWKKGLYKHKYLEEGTIAELTDHLLDEIENQLKNGIGEDEAFEVAKSRIGDLANLEVGERQVNARFSDRFLIALLFSFLKSGNRFFKKNLLTGSINLFGLIVAFTSILFISLFIYDEVSFEKHHPDYERIYRLSYRYQQESGEHEDRAFSSGMWTDLLSPRNPSIEESFRFLNLSYGYIHEPESHKSFYEEGIYWSDPNFFEFLNFKMKYGSKDGQLKDLNSIILTESTSRKIFGEENPLGKTLSYMRRGNEVNMVVTGVIYDPPSNSHFQPAYIAHIQAIQNIFGPQNNGWIDKNPNPGYIFTYLKLNGSSSVEPIIEEMKSIWNEAIPDRASRMEPVLTPISSIHFNPPVKWEIDTPIDMKYIYGLVLIAIFILVIALTNFSNLITAQGGKRQKEIGLRKTLGSSNSQLRIQFFIESLWIVSFAIILSVGLTYFLTPSFNSLVDKRIDFLNSISSPEFVVGFCLLVALIIVFAGSLPAIYFTRNLGKVFNMNLFFRRESPNSTSRNILVVIQFTVAITLIISSMTIFNQLELINNGFLGKNRETVIGIRTSRMGDSIQAQRYRNRIHSLAGVENSTLGMHLPRQSDFGRINTKFYHGDQALFWNKFDADGGFIKTYNLELIAGTDFNRNIQPNALIVNRTAANALNISPEDAVGLFLREDSINYVFEGSDGIIIGVVEDFAYKSVKERIEPLVICANNIVEGVLSVKLGVGDKQDLLSEMNEIWNEIYPGRPFEYWFIDKEFERMYGQERRLGKLVPLFSILAIVISLLGLFALTIYIAELREKEIGIRKVLGCSSGGILKLLGWQYLKTLIPSIVISIPITYIGLNYWLSGFTYRVDVSMQVIILSISIIAMVALITVSIKSVGAARKNPIQSLKYE